MLLLAWTVCCCAALSLCRQWLFIVEGIPSVILGMVTYWLLPSHPLWDAWMLTPQEREMLHLRVSDALLGKGNGCCRGCLFSTSGLKLRAGHLAGGPTAWHCWLTTVDFTCTLHKHETGQGEDRQAPQLQLSPV